MKYSIDSVEIQFFGFLLMITDQNIATKIDQATSEIKESLISARDGGQLLLEEFVQNRILTKDNGHPMKKFSDAMKKNKASTFPKLYAHHQKLSMWTD